MRVESADDECVALAQAGNDAAFSTLAVRHAAGLHRFCCRLVGDADIADDLVQETLLRARAALPRLRSRGRFAAWLYGIAANLGRAWWRDHSRQAVSLERMLDARPDEVHAHDSSWTTLDDRLALREQVERLGAALDALPSHLRRTVVLHYLRGLSYEEVAAATNVPISTVKGRLFRSRARLRLTLGSADAEDAAAAAPERDRRQPTVPAHPGVHPDARNTRRLAVKNVVLQIEIDVDSLIDECFAFVSAGPRTLARPHYTARSIQKGALLRNIGVPRDVLENMIVEGVADRRHVADFVKCLVAGWSAAPL
jgi:RNA polymerase sigma-70 factor (ECF subfamily)